MNAPANRVRSINRIGLDRSGTTRAPLNGRASDDEHAAEFFDAARFFTEGSDQSSLAIDCFSVIAVIAVANSATDSMGSER